MAAEAAASLISWRWHLEPDCPMLNEKYAYQRDPSPACLYGLRSCKSMFIVLAGGSARSTEVFILLGLPLRILALQLGPRKRD